MESTLKSKTFKIIDFPLKYIRYFVQKLLTKVMVVLRASYDIELSPVLLDVMKLSWTEPAVLTF